MRVLRHGAPVQIRAGRRGLQEDRHLADGQVADPDRRLVRRLLGAAHERRRAPPVVGRNFAQMCARQGEGGLPLPGCQGNAATRDRPDRA